MINWLGGRGKEWFKAFLIFLRRKKDIQCFSLQELVTIVTMLILACFLDILQHILNCIMQSVHWLQLFHLAVRCVMKWCYLLVITETRTRLDFQRVPNPKISSNVKIDIFVLETSSLCFLLTCYFMNIVISNWHMLSKRKSLNGKYWILFTEELYTMVRQVSIQITLCTTQDVNAWHRVSTFVPKGSF